jgi:hypothetical protein
LIEKSKKQNKEILTSIKKSILTSKYRHVVILIIGISLVPISIVYGTGTEMYVDNEMVEQKFSSVLLGVKSSLIKDFEQKLEEMKEDPLDGLYDDEMPTAEEIFYSEWANDKFPEVQIPVIGAYIEEIGAQKIGDINLDESFPPADLNISSVSHPSGISITQSQALWNPQNGNSFVSNKHIWYTASEGDIESINSLKSAFNLTDQQIDQICSWIIVGKNTWIKYLSREDIFTLNPFIFFGSLIPGIALIGYGTLKSIPQIKKFRANKISKIEIKNKKAKPD